MLLFENTLDRLYTILRGTSLEQSATYSSEKLSIIVQTWISNAFIVGVVLLLALRAWKWRRKQFSKIALILTIIDLFILSRGNLIAIPFKLASQEIPVGSWMSQENRTSRFFSTSGNLAYTGLGVYFTHLRAREPFSPNGLTDRELADFSRLKQELFALPENQGMDDRLFDVSGYAAAIPASYLKFWQANPTRPNAARIDDLSDQKLDLMGTNYFVTGYPQDFIAPLKNEKFELVYEAAGMKIYRNLSAWPRAFLDNQDRTPVSIDEYSPTRVRLRVTALEKSNLVLTDTDYPGWIARVDGQPTHINRYLDTFRMVSVPEGAHQIEFHYEPSSFKTGAIISLITLLGLLGVSSWERRRKLRSSS